MTSVRYDTLNVRTTSRSRTAGVIALRATLFALLLLFIARTWADPDLWGHVKFGGDIASIGLQSTDRYSFGSDRPWINHEWLAELVMYESWAIGKGLGLIAVKTALTLAVLWFVVSVLGRTAMSSTLRVLLLFTAVAGLWARVYVFRPQIFSLVLFSALLWVFRSVENGRTKSLWITPVLFGLWINLHGGWIVGCAVLAIWSLFNLTRFASAKLPPVQLTAVLAASVLATLVNPYGPGMWHFISETVRLERGMIADWRPLLETGAGKIVAWGTAAILTCSAFLQRRPPIPLAHALLAIGLGIASLKVSRLDAFFVLAVVMLLTRQIAAFAEGKPPDNETAYKPTLRWAWAVALLVGGAITIIPFHEQFRCVRLDGPWMPEPQAVSWIKDNGLRGRLLTWFDWGEYAIWHFAPELKVSLDARRETVYSDEYLTRHANLYFNPGAERAFLRELNADYAWLSTDLPLAATLEGDGWTLLFKGPKSVVLARRAIDVHAPPPIRTPACFPGP